MSARQTDPGVGIIAGNDQKDPLIPAGSSSTQFYVEGVALGSSMISAMLDPNDVTASTPFPVPADPMAGPYCTASANVGAGTVNVTPSGLRARRSQWRGQELRHFCGLGHSAHGERRPAGRQQQLRGNSAAQRIHGCRQREYRQHKSWRRHGHTASVIFTAGVDTVVATVPPCSARVPLASSRAT